MKQLVKKALLFFLFVSTLGVSLQAQKFGYIDSNELLSEMTEVKAMRSELEGFQKVLQKSAQEKVMEIQELQRDAMVKDSLGLMTRVEREKVSAELQKKQQEYMELQQDLQQKLVEKEQELLQPIIDKVDKAIQDVAKENGFQYVFDASVILFAEETTNIKELVKAKL